MNVSLRELFLSVDRLRLTQLVHVMHRVPQHDSIIRIATLESLYKLKQKTSEVLKTPEV